MLSSEPVFFYMDSSVRILSANFSDIFHHVLQNKGVAIFGHSSHSNARVTWPPMYEYLPTNISRQNATRSSESTMLYINTHENYSRFMRWHILCALVKGCIAPTDKIRFNRTVPAQYPACHRYDMAALNILLSNYHNFDKNAYSMSPTQFHVKRGDRKLPEADQLRFNDLVLKQNNN